MLQCFACGSGVGNVRRWGIGRSGLADTPERSKQVYAPPPLLAPEPPAPDALHVSRGREFTRARGAAVRERRDDRPTPS